MASFVVVLVGFGVGFILEWGEGGGEWGGYVLLIFFFVGKFVMSIFCNVIMLLLLYVHVCVMRTAWKTRPRPKTIILPIKKSNQILDTVQQSH